MHYEHNGVIISPKHSPKFSNCLGGKKQSLLSLFTSAFRFSTKKKKKNINIYIYIFTPLWSSNSHGTQGSNNKISRKRSRLYQKKSNKMKKYPQARVWTLQRKINKNWPETPKLIPKKRPSKSCNNASKDEILSSPILVKMTRWSSSYKSFSHFSKKKKNAATTLAHTD